MEEDQKNEPQKMISSTTDQKDDVAMNEAGCAKVEEDRKNKAAGKMISSTSDHQKEGGDDDVGMNAGSTSSDSSTLPSKKRKGPETETTSAETSSKKRKEHPPGSVEGRFILNLDVGQDLMDAIFELLKAYPRQSVIINSVTGSVKDVVHLSQNRSKMLEGEFRIISLSVKCLVDDDGRLCCAKAACSVMLTDGEEILYGYARVNSLKAASPVEIIASTFTTDVAKEAGVKILADAAAARNSNSDSKEIVKEVGQSSHLSPAADGNINPTTTTSTANDQDMKSPSNIQ